MSVEFVDTNVQVYARDEHAGVKRAPAARLLEQLWRDKRGATSIQVLCEFYAVTTQKLRSPLSHEEARLVVHSLSQWCVHAPSSLDVLRAGELAQRYRLSFWDAMIVRSAIALECSVLWSEDFQDGAVYDGVTVRNPFK